MWDAKIRSVIDRVRPTDSVCFGDIRPVNPIPNTDFIECVTVLHPVIIFTRAGCLHRGGGNREQIEYQYER